MAAIDRSIDRTAINSNVKRPAPRLVLTLTVSIVITLLLAGPFLYRALT